MYLYEFLVLPLLQARVFPKRPQPTSVQFVIAQSFNRVCTQARCITRFNEPSTSSAGEMLSASSQRTISESLAGLSQILCMPARQCLGEIIWSFDINIGLDVAHPFRSLVLVH